MSEGSFIMRRNAAGVVDFMVRIKAGERILNVIDWLHHCGMDRQQARTLFNNPFMSTYTYPYAGWNGDAVIQWRSIMPFLREMVEGGLVQEAQAIRLRDTLREAHKQTFTHLYKKQQEKGLIV